MRPPAIRTASNKREFGSGTAVPSISNEGLGGKLSEVKVHGPVRVEEDIKLAKLLPEFKSLFKFLLQEMEDVAFWSWHR